MPIAEDSLKALFALPARPAPLAPLLCFLHGYGEAAPLPIESALSKFGPLQADAADLAQEFVVLAPQLPHAGDDWHLYEQQIRRLVLRLQREQGADPRRCYLSGFSYGGNGVFDLGMAQPDLWAALWPVDPPRLPARGLMPPVWLSIGEITRRNAYEFIDRLQSKPPDGELLSHRVHLDQQLDHVGCALQAYADTRIYRWLLRRVLPVR